MNVVTVGWAVWKGCLGFLVFKRLCFLLWMKMTRRLLGNLFLTFAVISCSQAAEHIDLSASIDQARTIACDSKRSRADIRHQARLDYIDKTVNSSRHNLYTEVIRLQQGIKPSEDVIRGDGGLARLKQRRDAADFRLPAILTILHKYSDSPLLI